MDKLLTSENIVDQDMLRQVEALCTQEDPPACAAACPLHLDVRELCRLVADGDFAAALKLYQKAIPFARLVAATCDAPCQSPCKRAGLGGAVEIRRLEQAVAREGGPAKPPLLLSKKDKRAAVVGGGLSGLAAAGDLARKGYRVTLFEREEALGGRLRALPQDVLPRQVLEEEINALLALKVEARCGEAVPLGTPQEAAAFLLEDFDAAYVSCGSPLDGLADGDTQQVAGQTALLAGRRAGRLTDGPSAIYDIYDGRSAAATMDRLFQAVHLMAGREKEGSRDTGLFTSLDGIEPAPPVVPAAGEYTPEEAVREAVRCIGCECLECVKKCGFMQHYKRYPRLYVREVYNNLSIAMGQHHANGMINTCALCGQCGAVCPNGLDMAGVFRAARERMVDSEKMPPSAHEFAMLDMDYSLSDAFYWAGHQPGHGASATVFFPGCQLAASEPGLVESVYDDLCGRLTGGVGLWLACCGVMAHWAGEKAAFDAVRQRLAAEWEGLGRPQVVAACPTCAATLRELCGIPAVTLFEVLAEEGVAAHKSASVPDELVLHHACGARHQSAVQQSVAHLAANAGVALQADAQPHAQDPCCGYGGLVSMVDGAVADAITAVALAQLGPQGQNAPVLTYCVNCRDRYLANGRDAWYILELLYPGTKGLRHQNPTWSQRQENRAKLKRTLLAERWGIKTEEGPSMTLYLDEALEAKLERTHILHSDLERAISRAEAEAEKLLDPKTGHFTTSNRPGNVTFWVEYAPEQDGYRVFNAYSHRMLAVLTDKMTEGGAAGE